MAARVGSGRVGSVVLVFPTVQVNPVRAEVVGEVGGLNLVGGWRMAEREKQWELGPS